MSFSKIGGVMAMGVLLLFADSAAWPAQPAGQAARGPKSDAAKKSPEVKSAPAPVNSVKQATHFVKKIEGGFLYTEGGKYSLSGVKVVDLTGDQKGVLGRMPKKTAQMSFVNGQLREVVIRQRQQNPPDGSRRGN